VTVQFRGKTVVLHHNVNIATIDRKDFKELVASNRRYRKRHAHERPGASVRSRREEAPGRNQPGKALFGRSLQAGCPELNPMPPRSNTAPKKTAPSAPEPLPNSPSTQQWNDGGP